MPYITRDDGERLIIPSYRDVLASKQKNILKKEILLLSQNYGEYIAMQKKSATQYEVAFSNEQGYLLGESVWHYFKRPEDMIYCEEIPNTTEAIVVIVKGGSVYLDGNFPTEGIPEELVIFLTQENNFEIYVYGNVPISENPESGKFSFDRKSVKSFTILDHPIIQTLPLLRMYQLRLVAQVLKEQGIGVFPLRNLIAGVLVLGLGYMLYNYLMKPKEVVQEIIREMQQSPYASFYQSLTSPDPIEVVSEFIRQIKVLFTMPGWEARTVQFTAGQLTSTVQSMGGSIESLYAWADDHQAVATLSPGSLTITLTSQFTNRLAPTKIYPLKEVLAMMLDRMTKVYPGNVVTIGAFADREVYTVAPLTISLNQVSLVVLDLIAKQFKDLPLVITSISGTINPNQSLNGTITLEALGS